MQKLEVQKLEVLKLEVQKLKVREMEVKEQEIKELVPQELEVQKPEACKFIAPRVVEKASVTLPSCMVNEREASLCTLQQLMNSSTTFFRRSRPVIILGGKVDT